MAGLPSFVISTQTDPYWEIPFYDAQGLPLSVAGRVFEAWVTPAITSQGVGQPVAPVKVLTFDDGLSLVPPTDGSGDQTIRNTFVHRVSSAYAQAHFPRGELTADILEVVGGARRLLVPVRLRYGDPAEIREFVADRAGVTFGAGRQPIVTPVAVAGQVGRRGAGFLTGNGPPTALDGEDGDYWIDSSAEVRTLYGPKAGEAWPVDGKPITSEITPELQAARDAAVASAAAARGSATSAQADRQAVDTGAAQVEVSRQAVATAQVQVATDKAISTGARTEAQAARDAASAAQVAADGQRVAAQIAASDARTYAALVGASVFDFNVDSNPSPSNDWNA
ncbi:hypothetical protein G3T14_19600 [Methylobacterium sp. BTF04]|uniref:hypothetical protein n=1 Tax=Methylobacterium sp. BTF04 TaxID=2708300 RepID=UPI0013CF4819|nr:hypothetical protein [Methylobacterium sp. BTF04]NEU14315.1 hypothetical protein [Methylobacterium sp. BTF04]